MVRSPGVRIGLFFLGFSLANLPIAAQVTGHCAHGYSFGAPLGPPNAAVAVYSNCDQDYDPVIISAASNAFPVVFTAKNHGLDQKGISKVELSCPGDTSFSPCATGQWRTLIGSDYTVTVIDADTFTIQVDTTKFGPFAGYLAADYGNPDGTGLEWQCVEFVRRYWHAIYQTPVDLFSGIGTASGIFDAAKTLGLNQYKNNDASSPQPQVGDILASAGGTSGHVAIVSSVSQDMVCAVMQNWVNDLDDGNGNKCMHIATGPPYNLDGFNEDYPIQGWIRYPGPPSVSSVINGASPDKMLAPLGSFSVYGKNLCLGTSGATTVPLSPTIDGTSLLLNGIQVPLLYCSPGQINAQVPENVIAGNSQIQALVGGIVSALFAVPVANAAPGVFSVDGSGKGAGAIEHADYSLVTATSPAKVGDTIIIYLTGLGITTPSLSAGQAGNGQSSVSAPTVTIGGQSASVLFAGASSYPGLDQVNVVVPNVPSGDEPVIVSSSGNDSQTGLTVSVLGSTAAGGLSSTLMASLIASPTTGQVPFTATLTAVPGGTAIGTINYTFYCNRSDGGTNITPDWSAKFDGVSDLSKSTTCTYLNFGTYTPKVIIERGNGAAQATQTVIVSSASASVLSLTSLNPSTIPTSTAPFQTSISANGSNFSNVNQITFTWSGSANGSATWLKGDSNWNAKVLIISDTSMSLAPTVTSAGDPPGTSTWTMRLTDITGATASQSFTVTYAPPTSGTLTASLTASPTSGQAPLNVMLTAAPGGTAAGTVNYTFYCNRSDSGTNITQPWDAKFDGVSALSQTASCSYSTVGTYTAKVIVERGTGAAQTQQTISVSIRQPAPTLVAVPPGAFSANSNPQILTVVGTGFQPGLTGTLNSPTGATQIFNTGQFQSFSSSTFTMPIVLNIIGNWTISVTNPDGQSSGNTPFVVTQAATLIVSQQTWNLVFTVGDPSATLGLQITNVSGGPITGTIAASVTSGSWLTVDGLTNEKWAIPGGALTNTGISVTANPVGLAPGNYRGNLVVNAPNASNPSTTVPVSATIYAPLTILTASLPAATAGQPYNAVLQGSGGTGTGYTWALQQGVNGTLPNGLTLSPQSGVISGTPTGINGSTPLTVVIILTDSLGHSATKTFQIIWQQALSISSSQTLTFKVGTPYVLPGSGSTVQFTASGGAAPYTWSASPMPAGLTLDPKTGAVIGTPTNAGTFNVSITVMDSSNPPATASQIFSLVVTLNPVAISNSQGHTSFSLTTGVVGTYYEYDIFASGGTGVYSWTLGGSLPQGITGTSQNCNAPTVCFKIEGTPTQSGSFPIAVSVRDSLGTAAPSQSLTLIINAGTPPQITSTTYDLSNNLATIGAPYGFQFAANGGTPPYQWSLVGAYPDPGLQVSPAGLLSGTTTLPNDCIAGPSRFSQNYSFEVRVVDSTGQSAVSSQLCLPSYWPTPNIVSITPSSIPVDGQTHTIAVSGSNFRNDAVVHGNLNQLTFATQVVNSTTLNLSISTNGVSPQPYALDITQSYSNISNLNVTVVFQRQ